MVIEKIYLVKNILKEIRTFSFFLFFIVKFQAIILQSEMFAVQECSGILLKTIIFSKIARVNFTLFLKSLTANCGHRDIAQNVSISIWYETAVPRARTNSIIVVQ